MKFSTGIIILAATALTSVAANPTVKVARDEGTAFVAVPALSKPDGTAQVSKVGSAPPDSVGIQARWCPWGFWCPDWAPYCNSCGWCCSTYAACTYC